MFVKTKTDKDFFMFDPNQMISILFSRYAYESQKTKPFMIAKNNLSIKKRNRSVWLFVMYISEASHTDNR